MYDGVVTIHQENNVQEKRAQIRKLMLEAASVADAAGASWHPIILLDISRIGLAFASAQAMENGGSHMLRFRLPGNPRQHEAVVSVVHSSTAGVPSGFRIGAKFVVVVPAMIVAIEEFIASCAAG